MKPQRRAVLGGALAGCLASWHSPTAPAVAPTIPRVDSGQRLADALRTVADGDEIHLLDGEHHAQAGVITHKRLTQRGVRGVRGRVMLRAEGAHAEGKATLVVRDGDVLIDSIEFGGARVPDGNGAGIRLKRGLHQMSSLRGRGVDPGQAHGVDLRPRAAFTPPVGTRRVAMADRWSPGAYQD